MSHIALGLLAAFIALAFCRESLAENDNGMQAICALFLGLIVMSGSYVVQMMDRKLTHYQNPVAVREAEIINNTIRFEDARLENQILARHLPMRIGDNGYLCKRIK